MIATTIEQSEHLLELGLDPNAADMCWVKDYTEQWVLIADTQRAIRHRLEGMYEHSGFKWQEYISLVPAWSLSALLDVMPKKIEIDRESYEDIYVLTIEYTGDDNNPEISYMSGEFEYVHFTSAKTTLLAAYEMVCWLLERGIIKKGGNK